MWLAGYLASCFVPIFPLLICYLVCIVSFLFLKISLHCFLFSLFSHYTHTAKLGESCTERLVIDSALAMVMKAAKPEAILGVSLS